MTDKNEIVPATQKINLERWLGRREAFGMIAGRCSAADAACLREIRNQEVYRGVSPNWDEFCRVHLRSSRKKIDTVIRQVEEHGPQFFHVTQMMRLTEAEYVSLKDHMLQDGLKLDGEIIAWSPENAGRITQEVKKLRAVAAPKKEGSFETLIQRFDTLNGQLDKAPVMLDDRQRRSLGDVLLRLSNLASRRGVTLIQR
jgi:hypothetical protein